MTEPVGEIVSRLLTYCGGLQCIICKEWDHKSRVIDRICSDCDEEIKEIEAEAEDW